MQNFKLLPVLEFCDSKSEDQNQNPNTEDDADPYIYEIMINGKESRKPEDGEASSLEVDTTSELSTATTTSKTTKTNPKTRSYLKMNFKANINNYKDQYLLSQQELADSKKPSKSNPYGKNPYHSLNINLYDLIKDFLYFYLFTFKFDDHLINIHTKFKNLRATKDARMSANRKMKNLHIEDIPINKSQNVARCMGGSVTTDFLVDRLRDFYFYMVTDGVSREMKLESSLENLERQVENLNWGLVLGK